MESHDLTPQEQLDLVRASREELSRRTTAPRWYQPALGGLMAAYVVALGTLDDAWTVPVIGLFLLGLFLLMRAYRRATGVWVSGFQVPGRRYLLTLLVAYVGAVLVALAVRDGALPLWWLWAGAAAVLVLTVVVGPRWEAHVQRVQSA